MKIAFNMQILWGNLVKQCVDGLEESSVSIFFKMRNSLFSKQTKTVKVAVFKKVSFESHPAHISLNKKSIVGTGVNLVTEVEQP